MLLGRKKSRIHSAIFVGLDGEIVGQRESMKNREGVLPIGTRVKQSYARLSDKVGTVIEYSEDGERMVVIWDGNDFPSGDYMIPEVRRAE